MSEGQAREKGKQLGVKVRSWWGRHPRPDSPVIAENLAMLHGYIHKFYGMTREEAEKALAELDREKAAKALT
jgi:hypothetical protein